MEDMSMVFVRVDSMSRVADGVIDHLYYHIDLGSFHTVVVTGTATTVATT